MVFQLPALPDSITLVGAINLSDVAVHPGLGGTPILDHTGFALGLEDDPTVSGKAAADGGFALSGISLRQQLVLRCSDQRYPGLVLEWAAFHSQALWGRIAPQVTIESTARSFLFRAIRDRYGAMIEPQKIPSRYLSEIMAEMFAVLEQYPEKLSATTTLEQVDEVKTAVASAANTYFPVSQPVYLREWTVLVYQAADNSLENAILTDLNEMKAVAIPDQMAVLVQLDTADAGVRRMMVTEDRITELGNVGAANSADPAYIADFVGWGRRVFPARRLALIIASHGMGWRRDSSFRGMVTDDSANAVMGVVQLQGALQASRMLFDGTTRPLDLLGFDACLMGLLEIAYQMRECASYLVFSQGNEPAAGWPYDKVLSLVAEEPGEMDAGDFGRGICDVYREQYLGALAGRYSGTMSLINLGSLESFFPVFQAWAAQIFSARETVLPLLAGIRDAQIEAAENFSGPERFRVQAFDYPDYRDLYELALAVRQSIPEVFLETDALLKEFPSLVEYAVTFGTRYSRAHGLSLALPSALEIADYQSFPGLRAYGNLDLALHSRWAETILAMNQSGIARVDGRNLLVHLNWSGSPTVELFIGEPENTSANGEEETLWYSSSGGVQTGNGMFLTESVLFNDHERQWRANSRILPGKYWVFVRIPAETGAVGVGNLVLTVSWTDGSKTLKKTALNPGVTWQALVIEAAAGAVTATEVPVATE